MNGNLKVRGTLNNMNVGNLGTGSGNVVFGGSAFNQNAAADDNTVIGNSAMANATTGNNNVAVGAYALGANTTGYWNNALGFGSLQGNTTGFQNIAVGNATLGINTTGFQNTAIGNQADVAVEDLNNATAIGHAAIVDASNKIQLGNTDVTSVNTSGTYTGAGFKTPNGTASEFLMADGSTSTGATGPMGPQGDMGPQGLPGSDATVSVTDIASFSSPSGATINNGMLSLTPADSNFGGVVTTGNQTFSGDKTFNGTTTASSFVKAGGQSYQYLMADGSVSYGNTGNYNSPSGNLITNGNVITSNPNVTTITNSTGISAPSIVSGFISTTQSAASQIFLPDAYEISMELQYSNYSYYGQPTIGTSFEFSVYNNGTGSVTLVLPLDIKVQTSTAITGSNNLVVSVNQKMARYRLVFTGTYTAMLFRIY